MQQNNELCESVQANLNLKVVELYSGVAAERVRVNELRRKRHTDRRIKTMNAINSVQLFLLVWTFTAVCRADDGVCSVSCKNVTGTVGEEVTLICSVPQKCSECCIIMYKFQYPEKYKDHKEICKQEFPLDPCDQRNSFTCRYTPTKAMTEKFRFFVQTTCGIKRTELTVNITEPIKPETVTETPEHLKSNTEASPRSNGDVVPAVTGCFIILILILILTMTIIYKTKSNYIKPCGFQKSMFLCLRHDEENDNSNCPENAINNTDSVV
ncbi:uncharacterized protein LOC127524255 [Ctenopharyngodon idella]|uniref:uncharacterized protein LOC127524255 n=1 Tax=Ctenopharyngodon idella TaxID=7959 RepID=UPI002230AE16|nr:uncharacterized protein LOC127524255 [Ctenopharyngodon idella]